MLTRTEIEADFQALKNNTHDFIEYCKRRLRYRFLWRIAK
jgi:hypothetical protein